MKEFVSKNPADILDKTRKIVIAEFEKSDEDVKDGMEISAKGKKFKASQMR